MQSRCLADGFDDVLKNSFDYDDTGTRKKLSRLRLDFCPDGRQSHFHRQNDEDKTA